MFFSVFCFLRVLACYMVLEKNIPARKFSRRGVCGPAQRQQAAAAVEQLATHGGRGRGGAGGGGGLASFERFQISAGVCLLVSTVALERRSESAQDLARL
jgi:hypothetical protein